MDWQKIILNHFCVWGYLAEVKIYNPQIKKIDLYFVKYVEKFKGYRFGCPSRSTKNVESFNAEIL